MALVHAQTRIAQAEKTRIPSRALVLSAIFALWVMVLVARLCFLQIVQYGNLIARAHRQQQHTMEIAPQRGIIFDRQMRALAMSLAVDSIYAVPSEIPNPEMLADLLARALGVDAGELLGRFRTARSFCWVKRKVSSAEGARVQALNLKGIYFQKETKRFYPKGELAAHVVGYVGLDDDGLAGIEYGMNSVIKGRPGRVLVAADARRQSYRSSVWEGQPGKNVVLTLDENIQYVAEKALAEAVRKRRAAGGAVIVQNPQSGEILAMANQPTFNPNQYAKSVPDALVNRAVAASYEPGSTFKLVTLSAVLEEKLTTPAEVINCQYGSIVLTGHVIHDHKPFGDLSVADVLAKSSDVGAIKLGLRLGEERFYRYIQNFGFGSRTDIALPGEERGLLKPPRHWSGISIGEISMGQEIGVTPLQLVVAYSTVANGGILFQPRIVREVYLGNSHEPAPPATGRRVVSEQTANTMKQLLAGVVESGTGTSARLSGYSAAGKTGTAQKIDASGRYSKSHFISSFVGFAPVSRPALTILVVIDSPVGAIYGAEVAAPVFRSIAEQTLGYQNVPLDNPSRWLQVKSTAPARPLQSERGDEAGFLPPDSESLEAATPSVRLASFADPPTRDAAASVAAGAPLLTIPDFRGQTLRQVAARSQQLGLELSISGAGLASEQDPPAGSQASAGTRVRVHFAR